MKKTARFVELVSLGLVLGCAVASAEMGDYSAFKSLKNLSSDSENDVPAVSDVQKVNYFENSTRRDPLSDEKKPLIEIESNGCTGFLVKNKNNDLLIATAAHCANFHFKEDCDNAEISAITESGRFPVTCDQVVVQNPQDDIVIFKAKSEYSKEDMLPSVSFLSLSAIPAPDGARLKVIGHPLDDDRHGALTVSENCWVNNGTNVVSLLTEDEKRRLNAYGDTQAQSDPGLNDYIRKYNDINAHAERQSFNCTTYGGDSGGPVEVVGQAVAYGMPAGSTPGISRAFPSTASAEFYTMAGFVSRNRKQLEQAGIDIVGGAPPK